LFQFLAFLARPFGDCDDGNDCLQILRNWVDYQRFKSLAVNHL